MSMHSMRLYGTTDGDGNATAIGSRSVRGLLYAVQWIDGNLADGVDGVLSTVNSDAANANLLTLTNADNDALYYPRHVVHSEAGAALTGTSGGDRAMPLLDGTPKLVISSGGATRAGGCVLYWVDA